MRIASTPATAYARLVPGQVVTVFGGTGFLGRRIVRHLHDSGFAVRIATRHPDRARLPASGNGSDIVSLNADVNDDRLVASAVSGAWAVVNAVSLYVERGKDTFQSFHVRAAERVAKLARQAGADRLVHISGIGSDARSRPCHGNGHRPKVRRGQARFHAAATASCQCAAASARKVRSVARETRWR